MRAVSYSAEPGMQVAESNKEEENNMCNLSSIEQYTIYQKNDIIILND